MAKTFLVSIDLNQNELQNAAIQNLATAPSTPVEGQVYYNTTSNKIFFWDGTAWVDISGAIADVQGTSPINVVVASGVATVSITPATGGAAGSMSAADKTKLDASTSANTPSTLVERDPSGDFSANEITAGKVAGLTAPTAGTDAANKSYVDGLVDSNLKSPDDYDASTAGGLYPTTYKATSTVVEGDTFYITGAGTLGTTVVNIGDLLVAKTNTPGQTDANWYVLESNRDQATETVKGVARLATQAETNTGTDDETIVTPLKLQTKLDNENFTRKYTEIITGTGSFQTYAITHNLNEQDVVVSIRDTITNRHVEADIEAASENVVIIGGRGVNARDYVITVIG